MIDWSSGFNVIQSGSSLPLSTVIQSGVASLYPL